MRIEKGIISNKELIFLFISLLQASTLTAAFISGITKQNTWLVLLGGFVIVLLLLLVYTSISNKYPGRNLIEINSFIYGKHLGKAISIMYIYYFWFIIPANLRYISDFFSTYLFTEIDISIFSTIIIVICIYAVKKGLEVIARVAAILSIFSTIIAIIITLLTIQNIHPSNFLPLFQINLKDLIMGINVMVSIPFGETIVFLMIFPYVNSIKKVRNSAFWGLIAGSLYFFIIILRNTAVLGNLTSVHVLPSYQVTRLINVGEAITRIEVLIAVVLLFNVFIKICIFYYATVLSIAQFFKLRCYKPLVIPIGIISLILSMSMYDSPVDEAYQASNYAVYVIPVIIIIPIISLIIALIRKQN